MLALTYSRALYLDWRPVTTSVANKESLSRLHELIACRPQVTENALSLDSGLGSEYRLDESLMERLMLPKDQRISAVAVSRLNLQRRMHPQIAGLMRATLYPYLQVT